MSWDAPLTDWVKDIETYSNKEIRKMTREAFIRIKQRTPEDSGQLKAGWYLKYMKENGILEAKIVNDVEYVVFVELGTYKMAGAHMVEQTLNELAEGVIK